MAVRRRRPRPGDIAKIDVGTRAAYLFYVGRHPEYGDVIRVLGHASPPYSPARLTTVLARGWTTFYPLHAAVWHGLAELVAHHDATVAMPTRLRRAGALDIRDGKIFAVLTWIIEEDGRERVVKKLSAAELQLPIVTIWSHHGLTTAVRRRYRPEKRGAPSRRRRGT